jgi:hypothetical protein
MRSNIEYTIQLLPVPTPLIKEALNFWGSPEDTKPEVIRKRLRTNPFAPYILYNENPRPIRSILKTVFSRWNAFAVLETPYLDQEFWHDHTFFYGQSFFRYPVSCERFHFFSLPLGANQEPVPRAHIAQLIEAFRQGLNWSDEISRQFPKIEYHGYSIFRPSSSCVVGRTAIQFDRRSSNLPQAVKNALVPEEKSGIPYLIANHYCSARICGTKIEVEGTAEFIQQDPNVGACATASVWVATRSLAHRFNLNKYSYSTITRQALNPGGLPVEEITSHAPTLVEAGLYPSEIRNALSRTGATALTIPVCEGQDPGDESLRLRQEVYSFVESGLPVLLLLKNDGLYETSAHVVVAVGHSLPRYQKVANYLQPLTKDENCRHYHVSSLVPVYYVHDDAHGPFNRLRFTADGYASSEEKRRELAKGEDEPRISSPAVILGKTESSYLSTVIAPVPPAVKTDSHVGLSHILNYFDGLEKFLLKINPEFDQSPDPIIFLWRSLLVETAIFKASLRRRNFHSRLRTWYADLLLPKHVWLHEFSIANKETLHFSFAPTRGRIIAGEFLCDPTRPRADPRCLTIRIGGQVNDFREYPTDDPAAIFEKVQRIAPKKEPCIYTCFQHQRKFHTN